MEACAPGWRRTLGGVSAGDGDHGQQQLDSDGLIAWRLQRYTTRDGIVMGAAVGFGFGALESSGYAFNALIVHVGPFVGLSLGNLVTAELLRGALAPVGHGLWTAILGGVLFRASRGASHPRITLQVIGAYILVSLLHSLWDSRRGIAFVLSELFMAAAKQRIALPDARTKAHDSGH